MEVNAKCGVMNIGQNEVVGKIRSYSLINFRGEHEHLRHTEEERDLGIIITPDFKFSAQAAHAAAKASKILGMLKRTFLSRDVELWATLYRTYVRPHLEFAVPAWSPFLRRDIEVLEKVQRRVTRLPKTLRKASYEERLDRMGLTTLEKRRERGDLIELFKISRGADDITWFKQPIWSEPRDTKRRREIVSSCLQRYNYFINRIANAWNALTNEVVESESVDVFKSRLDNY